MNSKDKKNEENTMVEDLEDAKDLGKEMEQKKSNPGKREESPKQ